MKNTVKIKYVTIKLASHLRSLPPCFAVCFLNMTIILTLWRKLTLDHALPSLILSQRKPIIHSAYSSRLF